MAGIDAPPTTDVSDEIPAASAGTVNSTLKDRILGTVGKTITSAAGGDPNAKSPLSAAIDKHHQQQADEANMHQRNWANYVQGHLLIRQGINPETQMRFDDPNYPGGPAKARADQQAMDTSYTNNMNTAHQLYLKSAGKTKELKDAITKQGDLVNHISNVMTQQTNAQTAAKGGLQPPPGSGGSPAAPGTTTSPASGVAAPAVNDEGNPGSSGGLTPPPKSDESGPAAAAAPAQATPAAKGNPQVPAPPAPPADEPYDVMTGLVQGRMNQRAQAIADQARATKREVDLYKAKAQIAHDYKVDEVKEAAKAKAQYPSGRASALKPISIEKARQLAEGGQMFEAADASMADESGNLDLKALPDDMMLIPLQINGHVVGYGVAEQAQKRLTFNNQVVAVPEFQQTEAADKGTVLGAARVGTTSTSSEPGVDASGNAATLHKSRTSTPVTGGGTTPPTQTPSPSSATPKPGGGSAASPTFPPPAKGGGGGNSSTVFTPSQYNTFRKVKTPLMEASKQIFGDPNDPNYKSLESYSDIAEDPKEREALAVAVRRSISGLDQQMSKDPKGIFDLIKNQTGFTNELISSQAEADRQAIATLSPRNQEAYAAIMSALGAMIGVRAATGGSAAKFSALALEREIPIPGVNSFSKAQFNKQLNGIAGEIQTGAKGIPIFDKDERQWLNGNVTRTGIAAAEKTPGGADRVRVQIPGQKPGYVLRQNLDKFQRDHKDAKILQ